MNTEALARLCRVLEELPATLTLGPSADGYGFDATVVTENEEDWFGNGETPAAALEAVLASVEEAR